MEKLATFSSEPTDDGRGIERTVVEINEIDAPLPRLGVVKPQRLRLNMKFLVGAGDLELFEVGVAVEQFMVIGDPVIFHPDI